MSPFFSVLGAKGSVRPTSDCTAQGQDEVGLGSSLDQAYTGYERGKKMEKSRKAPTSACKPIYGLWEGWKLL